jgi:hypothetical protein
MSSFPLKIQTICKHHSGFIRVGSEFRVFEKKNRIRMLNNIRTKHNLHENIVALQWGGFILNLS